MTPRVAYSVASYNHRPYVQQCVDSILAQTYPNVVLTVVDDGSTDGSREFLREYAEKRKFRYVENPTNLGAAGNFNRGVELAEGDYIGMLASDDWLHPEKVARQVAYLQASDVDAVLGPVIRVIDGREEPGDLGHLQQVFDSDRYLRHLYTTDADGALMQSGLFGRAALQEIGFLKGYRSDDWLMEIRFMQAGYRIGLLNQPLTYYRLHGTNSHRDAMKCLNELQLPVIRDFIPPEYHAEILSTVYHTASTKLLRESKRRSLAMQGRSVSQKFKPYQVALYVALLTSTLPGGSGPFRLARKLARLRRDRPAEP